MQKWGTLCREPGAVRGWVLHLRVGQNIALPATHLKFLQGILKPSRWQMVHSAVSLEFHLSSFCPQLIQLLYSPVILKHKVTCGMKDGLEVYLCFDDCCFTLRSPLCFDDVCFTLRSPLYFDDCCFTLRSPLYIDDCCFTLRSPLYFDVCCFTLRSPFRWTGCWSGSSNQWVSGGLLFVLCAGVGLACGLLPACQAVCCQQAREAETRDP